MGNAAITIDDDYTFTPFGAKICMVGTDTFGNKVILQYENLDACSHVSSIGTFFIYVHAQEADNAYLRLFINDTVVDTTYMRFGASRFSYCWKCVRSQRYAVFDHRYVGTKSG